MSPAQDEGGYRGLDAIIRSQKSPKDAWDERELKEAALKEKKIRRNRKYNAIIDFAKTCENVDSRNYHEALLELKNSIESKKFKIGLYHLDLIVQKEMRIQNKGDKIDEKELTPIEKEILLKYNTIIVNFAKKYKYTDSSIYSKKLNKLQKLFESKGIYIKSDNLNRIIREQIENQDYEEFKNKLSNIKSPNLNGYIHAFIEIYGTNYNEHIELLKLFLREKNIVVSDGKILSLIGVIQEKIELKRFEEELQSSDAFISIGDIDNFSGYEFEEFLKPLFEKMGYIVTNTPLSSDQGADLIIEKFGEKTVVQAKCYQRSVSNKAVQEVVASIAHYGAKGGMVVTNSDFTNSAIQLANSNGVELVDKNKLKTWLKQYPVDKNTKI